ncbi:MAG: ParB/RepB/Spo0J family partition protein [Gemmataceae bacterium]
MNETTDLLCSDPTTSPPVLRRRRKPTELSHSACPEMENPPALQPQRVSERRFLSQLQDHPQQSDLVGDVSEQELAELAESMRKLGLQNPIHILPNGTIVAGHQRVRAARSLGWVEIDVVVRFDLEEAGEVAIQRFLVEDNLHRRQMDPLTIARTFRRLKELEKKVPHNELRLIDRLDIRDRLARKLGGGISGRTLDRYEKVLETPRAVQNAVSQGQLPMVKALAIAKLPAEQQQAIAASIQQGTPAKEAVNAILQGANSNRRVPLSRLHVRFLRQLKKWTELALPHPVPGSASLGKDTIPVLDRALELLERVREAELDYLEALQAEDDELYADLEREGCNHGQTARPVPDKLTRGGQ